MSSIKKIPSPTGKIVIVENPLIGDERIKDMEELRKLPDDIRNEHLQNYMEEVWMNVKVLEVGPEVSNKYIKRGAKILVDPVKVQGRYAFVERELLFIYEHDILAVW